MSDFKNVDIHAKSYCSSLDELRKFIASKLPATVDPPDMETVDMGYIEPGHGGKGRKVWLFSDEDLPTMYKTFKGKKESSVMVLHTELFTKKGTKMYKIYKRKRNLGKYQEDKEYI